MSLNDYPTQHKRVHIKIPLIWVYTHMCTANHGVIG